MSKSILSIRLGVLWLLCTGLLVNAAESVAEQPNIVMVMCDDLGWGDVGFNGSTTCKTPHLDEMATNSLRFSRFYAQSPVCSPTRGSCLTGRHPFRYGIYFANVGHMKTEELTLAELLQKMGYRTGHFGKWHLGTLTTEIKDANRGGPKNKQHFSPPQANGFDVCFSTESKVPTYDPMLKPKKANGKAWDAIEDKSEAVAYGTYYWDEDGRQVTDDLEGDDSKVIMDRAVPFIEECAASDTPFFAVIWFHAPHLPVVASAEHRALYPEAQSALDRNYFGCVTALDEQMGRLRSTLAKAGVAANTMITFCSDNGPEGNQKSPGSAGHLRGRKRSLYEGGVRVPALIEWPAKIKPGSTDYPAVTSDYLPTILRMVGAELVSDRPIDGLSLLPVFADGDIKRTRPIGFQSKNQFAMTDNQYKIYKTDKGAWELYDLTQDPSEATDLSQDLPQELQALKNQFNEWKASCARSDAGEDY